LPTSKKIQSSKPCPERSRRIKSQNFNRKVKSVFILDVFLLLSSSLTVAQNEKSSSHQLSLSSNRLELAVNLGMINICQSNNPIIHYSVYDTMVVNTNAYDSTVRFAHSALSDTTVDTNTILIKQKSALTAVLLSAVIPGGGQIYNGSYWKVPIILGVQAFFITQWISNNKTYQSLRNQYADSLRSAGSPLSWSYQEQNYLSSLQQERDSYHDQRDSYAWYIAGVYLLSMLDAYIDAELSGFDVSPSLGVIPGGSTSFAVSFRMKF